MELNENSQSVNIRSIVQSLKNSQKKLAENGENDLSISIMIDFPTQI